MSDTSEETLPELVSRIVDDAKEVARAEVALVKAQALAKVAGYRTAAALFVAAYLVSVAALIALVVGLVLTLAPRVGPGWATAIVVAATFAVAGLLGWLGWRRLKQA